MNQNTSANVYAALLDQPEYPDGDSFYGPSEDFPEIPGPPKSEKPNPVYRMVRQCLRDAGLDRDRLDSPQWSPLSDYVAPGGNIFILCNFVYHRLPEESAQAFAAKCTHASIIRPVIDYALKAVGDRGRVEFGNAPLQSCQWDQVLKDTGADRLIEFYQTTAPGRVEACDLRSYIIKRTRFGYQQPPETRTGSEVRIDLGRDSKLEEHQANQLYRVAQYDPRQIREYHRPGSHIYSLHRKIATADLIISIPKLKAHEKVGITGAIKGCVGATTFKQCLAHHRKGDPTRGGDEFPAGNPINNLISGLSDWTWTRPEGMIANLGRIAEKLATVAVRKTGGVTFGAWPGNDTCWRMAIDIARCVRFVAPDGNIRPSPRPHIVITDGIIGGQGSGPLKPQPAPTGWVAFADDPYAADYANCLAMGWDPDKLPILSQAVNLNTMPLTGLEKNKIIIALDGQPISHSKLMKKISQTYRPPDAWAELPGLLFK